MNHLHMTISSSKLSSIIRAQVSSAPPSGYSLLRVSARSTSIAEVMIYGLIGGGLWGDSISAQALVESIRSIQASELHVRINSDGGVVSDGFAIYNALRSHSARKVIWIDGQACSIASLIAMAGDEVVAFSSSLFMVHAPSTVAAGHAESFRQAADMLDTNAEAMLPAYVRKVGKADRVRSMLRDGLDHWFTAQEAADFGFVDRIADVPAGVSDDARAVALTSYVSAIAKAPAPVVAALRGRIVATVSEGAFSQLPPDGRAAVISQIEDPEMQNNLLRISANAGGPAGAAVAAPAAPIDPLEALRQRNTSIVGISEAFRDIPAVAAFTVRALADPAMTLEQYQAKILGLVGNGATPLASSFSGNREHAEPRRDGDDFIAAATDALAIRSGLAIQNPHPGARDLSGTSVLAIANLCLSRAGTAASNATGRGVIQAAMTTSDFPAILENSVARALRRGYEVEPRTYEAWTRLVLVEDFRDQARPILGSAPEFKHVGELGEYEEGSLTEDAALPYAVEKYGRIVSLSWEALKNDDLSAFMRVVQGLGQAAGRKEADLVYSSFLENSGAGPVMQGGQFLFHADHKNLAASQTGVNVEALSAGRVLLRRQTAVGGGVLNLSPRYLLVSPEHESAAEVLLAASARAMSQGADNKLVTEWMSKLELVVEARLNSSAIYLLTSPEQVDTYERAHLNGERVPDVIEEQPFKVDAQSWRARHTCGGRWLDWRGAVKIPISG